MLNFLLNKKKIKVDAKNKYNFIALHVVAQISHVRIIKLLIKKGANINTKIIIIIKLENELYISDDPAPFYIVIIKKNYQSNELYISAGSTLLHIAIIKKIINTNQQNF